MSLRTSKESNRDWGWFVVLRTSLYPSSCLRSCLLQVTWHRFHARWWFIGHRGSTRCCSWKTCTNDERRLDRRGCGAFSSFDHRSTISYWKTSAIDSLARRNTTDRQFSSLSQCLRIESLLENSPCRNQPARKDDRPIQWNHADDVSCRFVFANRFSSKPNSETIEFRSMTNVMIHGIRFIWFSMDIWEKRIDMVWLPVMSLIASNWSQCVSIESSRNQTDDFS